MIGVINAKGGSGKTTTAVYLATAFSRRGLVVELLDLDPQGSASEWAERAEENGDPLPFAVKRASAKELRKRRKKGSVVVVDTPPGDPETLDAVIEVADYVVVPTRPYGIEMARMWDTLPSLRGKAYGVLVTSARLGTRALDAVLAVLDAERVPRFSGVIPLRESIPDSWGQTPDNLEGYDTIAKEIFNEQ